MVSTSSLKSSELVKTLTRTSYTDHMAKRNISILAKSTKPQQQLVEQLATQQHGIIATLKVQSKKQHGTTLPRNFTQIGEKMHRQQFKSGDTVEVIDPKNFYFGKTAEVVEKTDYMGIWNVRIDDVHFTVHISKMRKVKKNDG